MVSSATGGARERLTTPTDAAWTVSGAARCTAEDCVAAQEGELPPPHWRLPREFGGDALEPQGWVWQAGSPMVLSAARPVRLSSAEALDVRMAMEPTATRTPTLRLVDESGRSATLRPQGPALRQGIHGATDAAGGRWLAQTVRFVLSSGGIDLARITRVVLDGGKGAAGRILVLDLSSARSGIAARMAPPTSILTAPSPATVIDGSTPWTHRVTVALSRPLARPATLRSLLLNSTDVRLDEIVLPAGRRTLDLALPVDGNTEWTPEGSVARLLPVQGPVVVASPVAAVTVTEGDPQPRVSITPATATATPGGTLSWKVSVENPPRTTPLYLYFMAEGTEPPLLTSELSPEGRQWWSVEEGEDLPLDQAGAWRVVEMAPGSIEAHVTMPLSTTARPGHRVRLVAMAGGIELTTGDVLEGVLQEP